MDFVKQVQGFTIGYVREKALNLTSLLRLVNSIQKPYRVIIYSEYVERMNREPVLGNPNKIADPRAKTTAGGFVIGKLQEPVQINLESKWVPMYPLNIAAMANLWTQPLGRAALIPFMTRRMWVGSEPIKLQMKLQFRTDSEASYDVLQQVRNLQMMVCPGGTSQGGQIFGITPPGPAPYRKTGVPLLDMVSATMAKGESSYIEIGEYFRLSDVLVTNVQIKYSNRMSADIAGIPIAAEAVVGMESYEIMTKQAMRAAYTDAEIQTRIPGPLEKVVDFIGDLPNQVRL